MVIIKCNASIWQLNATPPTPQPNTPPPPNTNKCITVINNISQVG